MLKHHIKYLMASYVYLLSSMYNFSKNFGLLAAKMYLHYILGTNLVLGPPEKFYRRNPSGTFRDTHWYHLDNPKKVPGAPSKGFLIFLGFDRNITKTEHHQI